FSRRSSVRVAKCSGNTTFRLTSPRASALRPMLRRFLKRGFIVRSTGGCCGRRGGCARCKLAVFRRISFIFLSLCCCSCCLRYETGPLRHLVADGAVAGAGAADQRVHPKLEGPAAKPPRPARRAALFRSDKISAQGHGYFRTRVVGVLGCA